MSGSSGGVAALVVVVFLVLFVVVTLIRTIRIVPQATSVIVERLGRYSRTLDPGLHLLVPFIDRARAVVDLRVQVVSFPPQSVITSDNLVVNVDTVIYFQVTNAKAAVYEIENYIVGIEQLAGTTLRNVIGSLDLEQTLTSRDQINGQLRGVLDEVTGTWGIRVNEVGLKAIDPPASVQDSMEQQMRAERQRRATILTAEGVKQSEILTAEGDKQSRILRAEGQAQAAILEAQGEARAIQQVFDAIHRGNPDQKLLAYQYLQVLPQIAKGDSNKLWIVPSELGEALKGIGGVLGRLQPGDDCSGGTWVPGPVDQDTALVDEPRLQDPSEAVRQAREQARSASEEAQEASERGVQPGRMPGRAASTPPQLEVDQPPATPTESPEGEQPPTA